MSVSNLQMLSARDVKHKYVTLSEEDNRKCEWEPADYDLAKKARFSIMTTAPFVKASIFSKIAAGFGLIFAFAMMSVMREQITEYIADSAQFSGDLGANIFVGVIFSVIIFFLVYYFSEVFIRRKADHNLKRFRKLDFEMVDAKLLGFTRRDKSHLNAELLIDNKGFTAENWCGSSSGNAVKLFRFINEESTSEDDKYIYVAYLYDKESIVSEE